MKIPILLAFAAACSPCFAADHEALCSELAATERNFCAQVATMGLSEAFLANMADDAFNADGLRLSKADYAEADKQERAKAATPPPVGPDPSMQLTWAPIKVDVSGDGTLGYTWGRYDFSYKAKDGKVSTETGIYLTVWKRQADGKWKYVFDGAPALSGTPADLKAFLARADLPKPPK